jgi:hypothetical protein
MELLPSQSPWPASAAMAHGATLTKYGINANNSTSICLNTTAPSPPAAATPVLSVPTLAVAAARPQPHVVVTPYATQIAVVTGLVAGPVHEHDHAVEHQGDVWKHKQRIFWSIHDVPRCIHHKQHQLASFWQE